MTKAEFDALPQGPVPANADRLLEAARQCRDQASRYYSPRTLSGADTADAPRYDLQADAYGSIASGKDVDAVLALCRAKWVAYCAVNNAKIDAALETKRGPMSGHSVLQHRYTDPERWDATDLHIRAMVKS